jgi:hypothetical protein
MLEEAQERENLLREELPALKRTIAQKRASGFPQDLKKSVVRRILKELVILPEPIAL